MPKRKTRGHRRRRSYDDSESEHESDVDYCPKEKVAKRSGKGKCSTTPANSRAVRKRIPGEQADRSRDQFAGWSLLPPELLLMIFEELVELNGGALPVLLKVGGVCVRWRAISLCKSLWRQVSVAHGGSSLTNKVLAYLAEHKLNHTVYLNLQGCKASRIHPVDAHCKELTGLEVTSPEAYLQLSCRLSQLTVSQCTSQGFRRFRPDMMACLTYLSLSCRSDQTAIPLTYDFPNLKDLSLDKFIVDWPVLTKNCPQLEKFTCIQCTMKHLSQHMNGLEGLKLFRLIQPEDWILQHWDGKDGDADGHILQWLGKCPQLRSLEISGRDKLWKYILAYFNIFPALPPMRLKHLVLRSLPCSVSIELLLSSFLTVTGEWLRFLQILNLRIGDSLVFGTLPNLSSLRLEHCTLSSDICLRAMAACPSLTFVSFAGNYRLPRGAKQEFCVGRFDYLKNLLTLDEVHET